MRGYYILLICLTVYGSAFGQLPPCYYSHTPYPFFCISEICNETYKVKLSVYYSSSYHCVSGVTILAFEESDLPEGTHIVDLPLERCDKAFNPYQGNPDFDLRNVTERGGLKMDKIYHAVITHTTDLNIGDHNVLFTDVYFRARSDDDTYQLANVSYGKNDVQLLNLLGVSAEKLNEVKLINFSDLYFSASQKHFSDQQTWTAWEKADAYHNGRMGRWFTESSYVQSQINRSATRSGNLDVRRAGILEESIPWFDWGSFYAGKSFGNDNKEQVFKNWTATGTTTLFNAGGQGLESVNPLGIYSAVALGYFGNQPVAVANNARYAQIAYCGFEENEGGGNFNFIHGTDVSGTAKNVTLPSYQKIPVLQGAGGLAVLPLERQNVIDNYLGYVYRLYLTNNVTGAQKIIDGIRLSCIHHALEPGQTVRSSGKCVAELVGAGLFDQQYWTGYLEYSASNSTQTVPYLLTESAHAFTGKRSLVLQPNQMHTVPLYSLRPLFTSSDVNKGDGLLQLDVWVRAETSDYSPSSYGHNLGVRLIYYTARSAGTQIVDGTRTNGNMIFVEGWRKLTYIFDVSTISADEVTGCSLVLNTNSVKLNIDDIRLLPLEAGMQSYVYDPDSYRVTAMFDDNHFPTLYYYDVEGNLYLVKKVTERGIETVQENYQQVGNSN